MNRTKPGLDFTAKEVPIEAHVGDDIKFGAKLSLNKVDLLKDEYEVETFIYDAAGEDISDDFNFTFVKLDGMAKFRLNDEVTTEMGPGRWGYAIVVSLVDSEDEDDSTNERTYVNGPLILKKRSDVS